MLLGDIVPERGMSAGAGAAGDWASESTVGGVESLPPSEDVSVDVEGVS